ncbi:MAG: aldose epimerase family protein [Ferruginibacter sp.]
MAIKKTWWGNYNGEDIYRFTISNGYLDLTVSNFGATVIAIKMPENQGNPENMVLGYDTLEGYVNDTYYMGGIVGRFANRISDAAFIIGQQKYQLTANETGTGNHLHGGTIGFNKKIFFVQGEPSQTELNSIQFHYSSPAGEEGYPGNLEVDITYRVTEKDEVVIAYKASTDQTTPVNLTSHCYFNLSGLKMTATEQDLFINADNVLVTNAHYIPTGEIKKVKGTTFDFTTQQPINNYPGFNGYNECFVVNKNGDEMAPQATLTDTISGRTMLVKTTLPGIMLYTGDHLGAPFIKNQGVCLEAQFFPDSPNQPHFPCTLLHPGDLYQHTTIYRFK